MLSKVKAAYSSEIMSHKLEVVANHPADEFRFVNAACIYFNGKIVSLKSDIRCLVRSFILYEGLLFFELSPQLL